MKNLFVTMKNLVVFLIAVSSLNAIAGGGGVGVQYACSSQKLGLSFQLDNRPDSFHFKPGVKVLVHEPSWGTGFAEVTRFVEGDPETKMELEVGASGQRRKITVLWLGNSIVDGIRIKYANGMHLNSADDGKCLITN